MKNKAKKSIEEMDVFDDEFFAMLDFMRSDLDQAIEEIKQLKLNINQLVQLLLKNDIPIPVNVIDRILLDLPLE